MDTHNVSESEVFSDEFFCNVMDQEKESDQWILLDSPLPITVIVSLYLLVVLKLGPWFMEGREPYNIKNVMRIYNVVQVLYNAFCLYFFLMPFGNLKLPVWFLLQHSCVDPRIINELDYKLKHLFLTVSWYYLGLKILDLTDTVFMVLRKKYSHITFLHVYHHAGTLFLVWFTLKYIKAIQGFFPVFINLNIHLIMYGYYFLATYDTFKKHLWWKSHITKLQLLQMATVIAYLAGLYYNQCPLSTKFTYIWLFNVGANFILFANFYVRAYILKENTTMEMKNKTK